MKPEHQPDDVNLPAHDAGRTPLDWPRRSGRLDQLMAAIEVRKHRQSRRRQALLGGVAALCLAGACWFSLARLRERSGDAVAATQALLSAPERRALTDGTVVELKTGSDFAVDFSGALRRVTLLKGDAHFQVAKDASRPFVVLAGGVEFRAVGTAFAVQFRSAHVEMIVTEGTVAVERLALATPVAAASSPSALLATVVAGNQVVMPLSVAVAPSAPPAVTPITQEEADEKLAWRVPRIELNETPLAEAIATINRHSAVALELGDASLGRLAISGILRADNVEPLVRTLEHNYGIRADRSVAGKVTLRKGS